MYKELIISFIVIALIVVGNIITQNNTIKSVGEISNKLYVLREEIASSNVDKEKAKSHMNEIDKMWEEKKEKMSYYIEHNELEKVETELTKLKANIDTEEYATGVENLESSVFILEHIKDKNALKIVNVF